MKYKFRLEVEKLKCTFCDLIVLVEKSYHEPTSNLVCPQCEANSFVETMGTISVVEE